MKRYQEEANTQMCSIANTGWRHSTTSQDISQHHLKENDLYVKVGLLRKSPIISSSRATDSIKGLERLWRLETNRSNGAPNIQIKDSNNDQFFTSWLRWFCLIFYNITPWYNEQWKDGNEFSKLYCYESINSSGKKNNSWLANHRDKVTVKIS